MCGRSSLKANAQQLQLQFGADTGNAPELETNGNIAPTDGITVITSEAPTLLQMAHWGFWRKFTNRNTGALAERSFFNARGETIHEKYTFKEAFNQGRRCLILFDAFYEWMITSEGKVPFRISMKDKKPFAIAGIWEVRQLNGVMRLSACVITTKGNRMMGLIHNKKPEDPRMPAILYPEHYSHWLDPQVSSTEAKKLIYTFPENKMSAMSISNDLGKVYADDPTFQEFTAFDFKEREMLMKAAEEGDFDLKV